MRRAVARTLGVGGFLLLCAFLAVPSMALPETTGGPSAFRLPTDRTLTPLAQALINGPPLACVDAPDGAGTSCVRSPSDLNERVTTYCTDTGTLYRCRVQCWQWRATEAANDCASALKTDRLVSSVGVFYCPPRGINAACDANGAPTNGQVFAHGEHTPDVQFEGCPSSAMASRAWSWTPFFTTGRPGGPAAVGLEPQLPEFSQPSQYCHYGRSVHALLDGQGTFGAFFEFYTEGA